MVAGFVLFAAALTWVTHGPLAPPVKHAVPEVPQKHKVGSP
jgi:hypothetical protein